MNDIDKLDGMVKFKGKCGYEFIGGCRELKKYKQALEEIREIAITGMEGYCPKCSRKKCEDNNCYETAIRDVLDKINEVLDE